MPDKKASGYPMKNRLRELRDDRGWSQQTLADKAGTSQAQIDRLEKSERRMTLDWAQRLADALEVHPLELLEPLPKLTPDEKAILENYRGLAEDQKPALRSILDALAQSPKVKREAS